ncbi:TetR/AcrR family transcriptional regulator [Asticcacaulis sp. BYS171W]|uniref:TetR/AcrR family transcriptional regulator n=1 Tax=Asticcacaulis aquaticus TaxID=2984212 RepID=A0ABT5HPT2_9CAUL|nr:TetR/AcrR family transcriptional regulator [Asticcacaulis aquaticus]MDC7682061.1 TetR/AcrR family transcriptional regulator [Asticcacaulis aquaticus]
MTPSSALLNRVQTAFLEHGYQNLSMVTLATMCGFTRRSLYNYFSNKEEAFQAMFRQHNLDLIERAMTMGDYLKRDGASVLDILSAVLDIRYGDTWRLIQPSPHALEIKGAVFRLCTPIMIQLASDFQAKLAGLIEGMAADGNLSLKRDYSAAELAQMLADAARGVNQVYPAMPLDQLSGQYRRICRAILYGYLHEV